MNNNKQEKDIERALVRLIRAYGGRCLKWVCPGEAGVPDRICLLPFGRAIFVELKRPQGGKVSKLQEVWADRIRTLGYEHYFIHTDADLAALRERIEGVKNGV